MNYKPLRVRFAPRSDGLKMVITQTGFVKKSIKEK
jgi:hypothetical protein